MTTRTLAALLLIGGLALPASAQNTPQGTGQGTGQDAGQGAGQGTTQGAEPAPAQPEPSKEPSQQEAAPPRPIRNAPSPRALEFAAYIFSAVNVCGYRLGTEAFEALLVKQNTTLAAVSPRGPFGNRVIGIFTLMSNQMNLNREQACLAVAGEYGPEGSVAKNVLLPPGSGEPPAAPGPKPGQP